MGGALGSPGALRTSRGCEVLGPHSNTEAQRQRDGLKEWFSGVVGIHSVSRFGVPAIGCGFLFVDMISLRKEGGSHSFSCSGAGLDGGAEQAACCWCSFSLSRTAVAASNLCCISECSPLVDIKINSLEHFPDSHGFSPCSGITDFLPSHIEEAHKHRAENFPGWCS